MAGSDTSQQGPPGCWVGGDEWETHRPAIQDLYLNQNLPLKEVMGIMEERYGFRATQRMYKTRIKSWGLDKNFKESEVVELFRLRRERDRLGKPTEYMIRGRVVDWERVNSYVKRKGLDIAGQLDASSSGYSPSAREISCRTPSPRSGERFTSPASSTVSSFSSSSATTAISNPQQDARNAGLLSTSPYLMSTSSSSPRRVPSLSHSPSLMQQTSLALTPDRVRSFQAFLDRVCETVMFEDGDRIWGTTEYWRRRTVSEEWITTVRVKLALYRDYFLAAADLDGSLPSLSSSAEVIRTFRMYNRAFAMLEPFSTGIMGTRMFYLVNFFGAFAPTAATMDSLHPPSPMPSTMTTGRGGGSSTHNPFATTVVQLLESVLSAWALPPLISSPGGLLGGRPPHMSSAGLGFGFGGGGEEMEGVISSSSSSSGRIGTGGAGAEGEFRRSARRFLASVLAQMVRDMGVAASSEMVLLLHEDADGYPLYSPPPPVTTRLTRPPPGTGARDMSTAEALETAVALLARRDDRRAEEYLVGVVEATVSSTAKDAKALGRCARYHLSRICRRRGDGAQAREHLRRAVEESVFYEPFFGWDEAEFLFV
ncbi:hypothetical protein QBC47DRAFT_175820 [Echria macrotheca]|uniref:Clr5 domain-containing protein n=1 Tax=Echria macrotheca TaxID=438768 RepID=A0AAJ0BF84_9PEZI|nr:hypothetical protein QBC47DRAFT_175820 [Echria macrotheca]